MRSLTRGRRLHAVGRCSGGRRLAGRPQVSKFERRPKGERGKESRHCALHTAGRERESERIDEGNERRVGNILP